MTSEEARALFDAALDGELDADARRELDQALARDAALREEFARAEQLSRATAALAQEAPKIDLLSGVQHKLRERSGGRFYRDRFSEERGRNPMMLWMTVVSLVLVLAVMLWLAFDAGVFGPR